MGEERTVIFQLPTMIAGELKCMQGTETGKVWQMSAGTFVIGRSSECDLHLGSEPGVSKIHAKIIASETDYTIIDAESRNGTIVNRRPVRKAKLQDGDMVQICGCMLKFTQISGGSSPSLARDEINATDSLEVIDDGAPSYEVDSVRDTRDEQILSPQDLATSTAGTQAQNDTATTRETSTQPSAAPEPVRQAIATSKAKAAREVAKPSWPYAVVGFLITFLTMTGYYVYWQKTVANESLSAAADPSASPSSNTGNTDVAAPKAAADKVNGSNSPAQNPDGAEKPTKTAAAGNSDGAQPTGNAAGALPPPTVADQNSKSPKPTADSQWFPLVIKPAKGTPMRTPYGGRVRSIEVENGDSVKKGQTVLRVQGKSGKSRELETLKLSVRALEDVVNASGNKRAEKALQEEKAKLKAMKSKQVVLRVVAQASGTISNFSVQAGEQLRSKQVIGWVTSPSARTIQVDVESAIGFELKKGAAVTFRKKDGSEASGTIQKIILQGKGRYTIFFRAKGAGAKDLQEVRLP
jgi:pSer/pThr/pTyr-binding forkhead associated (FHA) protein